MTDHGVRVHLLHRPEAADDWLRFGRPLREVRIDRRRSVATFAAGSAFAYVRWRGGDFGTVLWRLWVLRAPSAQKAATTLKGVEPGAEMLLAVLGEGKVKQAFALIDAIEAAGLNPADVAPTYWAMAHNRLAANTLPRLYGTAEHEAYLASIAVQP